MRSYSPTQGSAAIRPYLSSMPRFFVAVASAMFAICGCAVPVHYFTPKSVQPPAMVNCVEQSCPKSAKPFILGGNDYSPPTIPNVSRWQRQGYFADKSLDQVQGLYRQRGYDWYEDQIPCNCLCRGTAHAALGGRCLEAPMPGTPEYEAVHLGRTN